MNRLHSSLGSLCERLENRTLLSGAVEFGLVDGKHVTVMAPDALGHEINFALNGPGTGSVSLVTGGFDITTTGTTSASTLAITPRSGSSTPLESFSSSASLHAIVAPKVELAGLISIGGTLGSLTLGDTSPGASIGIIGAASGSGGATAMHLGNVANLSLTTLSPIQSLTASSWTRTSASLPDSLSAPQIGQLNIKGSFSPNLNLTGLPTSLASANIKGAAGGSWNLVGNVQSVSLGSTSSAWLASDGAGNWNSLNVQGDLLGAITVHTLHTLRVGGNLTNASITLTGGQDLGTQPAMNSLSVKGAVDGSSLISSASLGQISVGSISASTIFAGISIMSGLPTSSADFASTSHIASFTVRLPGVSFSGSDIAAATLNNVSIKQVQTVNGGTPFGVAADTLGSFTRQLSTGKAFHWHTGQLVNLLTPDEDFNVHVFTF